MKTLTRIHKTRGLSLHSALVCYEEYTNYTVHLNTQTIISHCAPFWIAPMNTGNRAFTNPSTVLSEDKIKFEKSAKNQQCSKMRSELCEADL